MYKVKILYLLFLYKIKLYVCIMYNKLKLIRFNIKKYNVSVSCEYLKHNFILFFENGMTNDDFTV